MVMTFFTHCPPARSHVVSKQTGFVYITLDCIFGSVSSTHADCGGRERRSQGAFAAGAFAAGVATANEPQTTTPAKTSSPPLQTKSGATKDSTSLLDVSSKYGVVQPARCGARAAAANQGRLRTSQSPSVWSVTASTSASPPGTGTLVCMRHASGVPLITTTSPASPGRACAATYVPSASATPRMRDAQWLARPALSARRRQATSASASHGAESVASTSAASDRSSIASASHRRHAADSRIAATQRPRAAF
mmetsp:Transcript_20010/g.71155  ORF Transcript_20010/g.71155 Transcript_20010/m.71155 type:complete len:251 (+) Transcript_20010:548-1300(+)